MTATTPADETPAPPRRARAAAIWALLGVAVFIILLDQLTKHFATEELTGRGPVRILGGLVYLSLIRNSGAAFSMASGHTWIFPLIALAVIAWITWMAFKLRSMPWAIALGLVAGGALGNLTDRLFRAPGPFQGHVVDMISLFAPYGEKFAVFNIADSALSCGVVLAIILEFSGRQRDGTRIPLRKSGKSKGSGDK
ncbi:signal peptidase II [Asanoa sp. WMMD1127]|uniref:signal peptidase II n=1 Tax=Asanoa sp. WMMD1127 TaxID=3016107 RepID=UPI0024173E69|nr:signal peptidase II [Asanoa sp. WMMD1127]MDG4827061.1 signal peptidase II [Asanoa sp. WMMD1127]